MKLCIATDFAIATCNGRYYFKSQFIAIVRRYYDAFGKIVFCTRLTKLDTVGKEYVDVTEIVDDVVAISSLYKSFLPSYRKKIFRAVAKCDLIVARCPGMISYVAADCARKQHKPYFAESMGCAWDAYWNHGIVGKMIAPYMFLKMKNVVYNADYALYVTSRFLQNRYPCKNKSIGVSNVKIDVCSEEVLQRRLERIHNSSDNSIVMMTSAAVDVRYKGQEYVIKAIPELNRKGFRVRYLLAGGGDQTFLRSLAEKLGVQDQVQFLGRISLDEVFENLDNVDIYIQPSLQEGLPRSMIEAMSRGCPCIGAKTAGIPELISPECVVRRRSVSDIAQKVLAVYEKEKLLELAQLNFEKSKSFLNSVLSEKRNRYYQSILEMRET